jgi:hypothetical protein
MKLVNSARQRRQFRRVAAVGCNRNGEHMTMDNLKLLRTFVRVVEASSLTAVARESNASLSTVSRQIPQFEQHFGVGRLTGPSSRQ